MSKEYKIKINNLDENWQCEGFVSESVVDKIKKGEFVEFNLRLDGYDENDTATYQRYHYSPVKNMTYEILEFGK